MRRRPRNRNRRGASLVETAILLPLFLVFVVGAIDLGLSVFRNNAIARAARELARDASVHGSASSAAWGAQKYSWSFSLRAAPDDSDSANFTSATSDFGDHASGDDASGDDASAQDKIDETVKSHLTGLDQEKTTVVMEWLDGDNHYGSRVRVTITSSSQPILGVGAVPLSSSCTLHIAH